MSADGEISVAVRAEGVNEAAAEMGGDGQQGGGGGNALAGGGGGGGDGGDGDGDGGGGGGGIGQALSGGIVGGLVSQLLGPLLDILDPILKILNAFLAPVSAMLMRLLMPVLRFMIQLLPGWIQFINELPQMVANLPQNIWSFLKDIATLTWQAFKGGAAWLANGAVAIGEATWKAIKNGAKWIANGVSAIGRGVYNAFKSGLDWFTKLPSKIGKEIKSLGQNTKETGKEVSDGIDWKKVGKGAAIGAAGGLVTLNPYGVAAGAAVGGGAALLEELAAGGIVTGPTPALVGEAGPEAVIPLDRLEEVMGNQRGGNTVVSISGGLEPFVKNATRDRNYEV